MSSILSVFSKKLKGYAMYIAFDKIFSINAPFEVRS
ncbi:hypothetical protein TSMEX_011353 [Taenia solium]|eukprot:TsM_000368500 transcript=TsM_000368500 gene=TsM_000368500